jgi:hypothetical protein
VRTGLRCDCECLVVVGIYGVLNGFTAHSGRAKISSLNTRRFWFGPAIHPDNGLMNGGAAGYCPRVRCVYFTASFIAISGKPAQST